MAKKKIRKGTAIWVTEIGSIKTRVFDVVKENKKEGKILIQFAPNEQYIINKSNVRNKRIIMYKKSDGSVVSQNPDQWGRLDLKGRGIKTLRFNLQNSSLQESKSAIYRWTTPKDVIDKLGPIFKLMFICIAVGVMGWAALKFGGMALDAITSSRLLSCEQLLPKIIDPIGAIVENATIPVGAG